MSEQIAVAASPYQKLPPPTLNGGLYTGEPFAPGAPWRNFPATPDVSYMIHHNLRSAHPPLEALTHYPAGNFRPGNNLVALHGVKLYAPTHGDMACTVPVSIDAPELRQPGHDGQPQRPSAAKYAYLT